MKYDIGFITTKSHNNYIASCGCGTVKLLGTVSYYGLESLTVTCEGCGNTNFAKMRGTPRVVFPYIEVLEKSRTGFKVKRTNLSVFYDDDFNVVIKENKIQTLTYDLVNEAITIEKDEEIIDVKGLNHGYNSNAHPSLVRFFTGVDSYDFMNKIAVFETETLYEFGWQKLSTKGSGWNESKKFYITMNKLFQYKYMQILANAGFPNVERFYEKPSYYNRGKLTINANGTSPKDILNVPKFVLKYIRENQNVGIYEIEQIKTALGKVDGNRFRELMEIVKDESTIRELCNTLDTMIEIHDTYNYNNLKKLTLYLFREIRMNQGISSPQNGATLLRDYIKMSTRLGQEFEKYPKSLKKEHDITQMNYKVQENEMKKKEFAEIVISEDYKRFEYKKKEYAIISPKEMQDLIKEGNELSHCVASYVEAITTKRCKIFFLRKSDSLDSPLATIEVRGGNVRQARGYANRRLHTSENEFIADWAKKKELELNYYY